MCGWSVEGCVCEWSVRDMLMANAMSCVAS